MGRRNPALRLVLTTRSADLAGGGPLTAAPPEHHPSRYYFSFEFVAATGCQRRRAGSEARRQDGEADCRWRNRARILRSSRIVRDSGVPAGQVRLPRRRGNTERLATNVAAARPRAGGVVLGTGPRTPGGPNVKASSGQRTVKGTRTCRVPSLWISSRRKADGLRNPSASIA